MPALFREGVRHRQATAIAACCGAYSTSLAVSGNPRVVIVGSLGSSENLENSSVPSRTPALLSASLEGIQRWQGISFVSPELYLSTLVT
jgi:hypothetical protein